jgi:soluble lytic murein transglycosylase
MALRRSAPGVDWAVAQVPDQLKGNPGLVYERLRWRRRKGKVAAALEMLEMAPDRPPRAEMWWRERAYLARAALAMGDVEVAYRVVRRHGQTSGADLADGEWLAGWIALRFQGKPAAALAHFETMYQTVTYPISRTRGAYWAGRAAEAMGDSAAAARWYRLAAAHPLAFYGQHAAARLGPENGMALPDGPAISGFEFGAFYQRELVRVTRLLAEIGERKLVRIFVRHLSRIAETPAERILIARLAQYTDRTDLAVWTARRASLAGVDLIDHGYPMLPLPEGRGPDPALVLAVIRQESGFDPKAVSPTGARGLMQLQPATARKVSRMLGTRYSKRRLTSDPDYNLTLGRAHLAELIAAYDGSYVLALAAYNAGPRRVKRWIKAFGDPRRGSAQAIDWIESIPLGETRNYVQRVLEGLFVYRLRFDRSNIVVTMGEKPR